MDKRFSASPKCLDWLWGPPSLLLNGYRGPLPGMKQQGREVYHLPPSTAKVKKEWSYTSSHHMSLYGVDEGRIYHYLSSP
jgi:hypothetical protein